MVELLHFEAGLFGLVSDFFEVLAIVLIHFLRSGHASPRVVLLDDLGDSVDEEVSEALQGGQLLPADDWKRILANRLNGQVIHVVSLRHLLVRLYLCPDQVVNDEVVAWVHCDHVQALDAVPVVARNHLNNNLTYALSFSNSLFLMEGNINFSKSKHFFFQNSK